MSSTIAFGTGLLLTVSVLLIPYNSPSLETLPASIQPNIIIFIADDVGWNDVSYHGSDQIATPNLAALGYHGVILKRHYTNQVCTPSRAAFLTGQYPIRIGFQGYPLGLGIAKHIPKDLQTLPHSLKTLGYRTHLIGKWHLGYAKREHTPLAYGYDTHFGYWNGYIGYFNHAIGDEFNGVDLHDNYQPVIDRVGEYATDVFTQRAKDVIKAHPTNKPLHLVISHLAGHTGRTIRGIETELEVHNLTSTNEKYSYIKDTNRRKYAEILERMDKSIGDILESLAEKDMLKNSVIAFFSDNGAPTFGMHANTGSNYPLRGIKMTMFEGAIRTPAIIYSPMIKCPGRIFDSLFHITDWVPTLYRAAGGDVEDLGLMDGIDQWQTLFNNEPIHRRHELLVDIDSKFNYSAYIGFDGRYKLVNNSSFFYNHSGDEGFSEPNKYYQEVKYCRTNVLLEQQSQTELRREHIIALRGRMQLKCNHNSRTQHHEAITSCDGVCLFDLCEDPCEYQNVAAQHPEIVAYLSMKLQTLGRETKPKRNLVFDPASDPKFCNHTWFNWLDDNGCWYNMTKINII